MSVNADCPYRKVSCVFALAGIAMLSSAARAQVADLAIENVANEIIVAPLRAQTVRLVVRNLGPDAVR